VPKRVNYFNHQFLGEKDFTEEQDYHLKMRRHHNRVFHSWGVAEGLEVRKKNHREITIDRGTAVDREGREIILETEVTHDLSRVAHDPHAYVAVAYKEEKTDPRSSGGTEGPTRVTEGHHISVTKDHPPQDGSVITLARVHFSEGNIQGIDMDASVRKMARAVAAPWMGWMTYAFKPVRLNPVRVNGRLLKVRSEKEAFEFEFTVDQVSAYCEERARGSMAITVPCGATKLKAFRIAGTTRGSVKVQLFRGGWNRAESKGELTPLLSRGHETVSAGSFHKHFSLEEHLQHLDPENHSLAVSVVAEGETEIWLIAAEFA
jgi:hypothetical protein